MFGRLPSLVLRSLIFMLPAISRLVMLDCSSQLSVLRDPIGHLDEKASCPSTGTARIERSRCRRRAHPSDPTQLHDFPLLVDGRPSVT